jgi:hypothetical protein
VGHPAVGQVQPCFVIRAKAELFRIPVLGRDRRAALPVRRGGPTATRRTVHDTLAVGGASGPSRATQAELEGAKAGAGRCTVVEDAGRARRHPRHSRLAPGAGAIRFAPGGSTGGGRAW